MRKIYIPVIIFTVLILDSCSKKEDQSSLITKMKPVLLDKGEYNVNVLESKLIWTGKKSTKQHHGTIQIKKGQIKINDSGLINGDIEIDMSTINTTDMQGRGKENLDQHLKDSDFFDVKIYPISYLKFHSNGKENNNGKLKFDGELTIKNITHPILFYSEIQKLNGKLKAKANVVFDRSLYDVKYGSGKFFDNLGDRLIHDEINIDVMVVTN